MLAQSCRKKGSVVSLFIPASLFSAQLYSFVSVSRGTEELQVHRASSWLWECVCLGVGSASVTIRRWRSMQKDSVKVTG